MNRIEKIEEKLRDTAPLGARDIRLFREESYVGATVEFKGPHWDLATRVDFPYGEEPDSFSYEDWWENAIAFLKDKENFDAANKRVVKVDIYMNCQRAGLTNIYAHSGEFFNGAGAFVFDVNDDGDFILGCVTVPGPGVRAAMEKGKTENYPCVYEPIDNTEYPGGDPEFFQEFWRNFPYKTHNELWEAKKEEQAPCA